MDFPDDSCSNKGLLPEGHRQLARQYERETDAGVDESIAATQVSKRTQYHSITT